MRFAAAGAAYHGPMHCALRLPDPTLRGPARLARPGMAGLVIAGLLVGCASAPPPSGRPPVSTTTPAPAAAPEPVRRDALEAERRWLQQWFDGTPVVIAQPQREALAVEVPREFCFDAGRAEVKPPLKAVLDKLAQSLRRVPQARVQLVAAPADAGGDAALARQRATRVREHLRSRGVPADRLGEGRATTVAMVQLRVQLP